MRKFLLPVINLVNVILVSIVWGLSANTAVIDAGHSDTACGNFYQVVWQGSRTNILGIIGFFLFCVAVLATLVAFLPIKARKFITCCSGLMYIAAGVMFLLAPLPPHYAHGFVEAKLTGSLIAMAVLVFVAGAFSVIMSLVEFLGKKESK